MGIAWFDDDAPPMEELTLRTGGLPLLPEEVGWPCCPRCELPMLFRAQLPLALTSLVSFDDERLLVVFECHALHADCSEATALVVDGALQPRSAPGSTVFDVLIHSVGDRPDEVMRVVSALDPDNAGELCLPAPLLLASPPSIAREAVRALLEAGGVAELRTSPPTTLSTVRGGQLVPFDDATPGTASTTLPPLRELTGATRSALIRGHFGGIKAADLDPGLACACGRPRRSAVHLIASDDADPSGVVLGPTTVTVCVRCGSASAQRGTALRGRLRRTSVAT